MNNPPAFPRPFSIDNTPSSFPSSQLYSAYSGMDLRDYLAAKAMQAMETRNASGTDYSRAIRAYEIADAMLAARDQK